MLRILLALVLTLPALRAAAQGEAEPSARDVVVAANTGLRISIAPGLLIPTDGGRVGLCLAADGRYGIELGPLVVAPGLRVSGFFPSGLFGLTALATGRLTVPLGPVGPFVLAGAGPGYLSEPSQLGLCYLGGGGLMVHVGTSLALGAELSYLGITGTSFGPLTFGPSLLLGF